MNLERFVKLMTWLSKRYPGAYIEFNGDDTGGFKIWDSRDNWIEWHRLEDIAYEKEKRLFDTSLFDKELFEKNRQERRDADSVANDFLEEHLKLSISTINRE